MLAAKAVEVDRPAVAAVDLDRFQPLKVLDRRQAALAAFAAELILDCEFLLGEPGVQIRCHRHPAITVSNQNRISRKRFHLTNILQQHLPFVTLAIIQACNPIQNSAAIPIQAIAAYTRI